MRLLVSTALLFSMLTWADCPEYAQTTHFTERKLTFGEAGFAAKVIALRQLTHEIISVDEFSHSVVVTVDAKQQAVLAKRDDLTSEDHAPLVAFPGVVFSILDHPKLEPLLATPGWQLDSPASEQQPYAVLFRNPTDRSVDVIELVSYTLGNPPDLELTGNGDDGTLRLNITRHQASLIARLPEVRWVGRVEALYKVSPFLIGEDCYVERLESMKRVQAFVRAHGRSTLRVHVSISAVTPSLTKALARLQLSPVIDGFDAEVLVSALPLLARQPEVIGLEAPSGEPTIDSPAPAPSREAPSDQPVAD